MLNEGDRKRLGEYFGNQPDVVAAFLFGSTARGDAHHGSDIDIAVLLERGEPIHPLRQVHLVSEVMSILSRNDVDLVLLNRASPLLLHRVARDGDVLYARSNTDVAEFVIYAIQQFEDTKPIRDLQRRQLRDRLRVPDSEAT